MTSFSFIPGDRSRLHSLPPRFHRKRIAYPAYNSHLAFGWTIFHSKLSVIIVANRSLPAAFRSFSFWYQMVWWHIIRMSRRAANVCLSANLDRDIQRAASEALTYLFLGILAISMPPAVSSCSCIGNPWIRFRLYLTRYYIQPNIDKQSSMIVWHETFLLSVRFHEIIHPLPIFHCTSHLLPVSVHLFTNPRSSGFFTGGNVILQLGQPLVFWKHFEKNSAAERPKSWSVLYSISFLSEARAF